MEETDISLFLMFKFRNVSSLITTDQMQLIMILLSFIKMELIINDQKCFQLIITSQCNRIQLFSVQDAIDNY